VPNRIITDLGKAFTGSVIWDFCQDNSIDVYYSSVAHPWCNVKVEMSQRHGPSGSQRSHLRRRLQLRHQMASRATARDLGSKDSSQFRHGLFTLLFGLQIRSCATYRRCLWSSTHPIL
jgi:hypothetical protein